MAIVYLQQPERPPEGPRDSWWRSPLARAAVIHPAISAAIGLAIFLSFTTDEVMGPNGAIGALCSVVGGFIATMHMASGRPNRGELLFTGLVGSVAAVGAMIVIGFAIAFMGCPSYSRQCW